MAGPDADDPMMTPAMAGPITLARLNCAEFRAMALTMASDGTSDGTNACHVGPLKEKARPWPKVRARTANSPAWFSQVSAASTAASSIMNVCVAKRIRLRSRRSVYTPPMGERITGKKFAKVTKDTQKAEWVMRKTCHDSAMVCIHVPMFERMAPPHRSR